MLNLSPMLFLCVVNRLMAWVWLKFVSNKIDDVLSFALT